jgi:hypothetical protein
MKGILRILPVALALIASPAVIPTVVEGPGRAAVRIICRAEAVEVDYHEPAVIREAPVAVVRIETPARIPLRGASTPRAPAV